MRVQRSVVKHGGIHCSRTASECAEGGRGATARPPCRKPVLLSGACWRRVAAARCGLLQTARFGKRLTNEWRRIETWTAWELHGAEWLPVRCGAVSRSAKQPPKNPQTLARP